MSCTSAFPAASSFAWFGRVALPRVVEDQNPVAPGPPGRAGERARPRARVHAGLAPRPLAGVVPPGLHLLAGHLVHANADGPAGRQVGEEETPVPGPRR